MGIHPTAIVNKHAQVHPSVSVGPYVIIEDTVKIAKDVKIYPHAYICEGTEIGEKTEIHMGAVIGHAPQDVAFKGGTTYTKIGKRNIIREYVTIHRGTKEGTATEIGDDNFFMATSHVGHNCVLQNKIVLANGALLGGYVDVESEVFISGNVPVHQFCRIGRLAMLGGLSAIHMDVPPYMVTRGVSYVRAVNLIGLKRVGFTSGVVREITEAFKTIYRSGLNTAQAVEKIEKRKPCKEVGYLVDFIKKSKRGICRKDKNYF